LVRHAEYASDDVTEASCGTYAFDPSVAAFRSRKNYKCRFDLGQLARSGSCARSVYHERAHLTQERVISDVTAIHSQIEIGDQAVERLSAPRR
jgi:hypothetical protein